MTTFIQSAVAAALISVFAAGAAQAQVQPQVQDRQVTRADVIAELQRARATGELERLQKDSGGYAALELGQPGKRLSRAEVVAELKRAQAAGELDNAFRESAGHLAPVAKSNSGLTREQVKAELDRARRSGEFKQLNANNHHAFEILG